MSNRVAGQTSTAPFILEAARKLRQDYSVSLEISAASAPGAVTVYGTKSQLPQAIAALNKRFDEWVNTRY